MNVWLQSICPGCGQRGGAKSRDAPQAPPVPPHLQRAGHTRSFDFFDMHLGVANHASFRANEAQHQQIIAASGQGRPKDFC